MINGRSTTATFNNPTSMTLQNNEYLGDGTLNPTRLQPKNAGFGAATGARICAAFSCSFASRSSADRAAGRSRQALTARQGARAKR